MKKFLVRAERVLIKLALSPELRPTERAAALRAVRSVAKRVGASSAIVAIAVELINRYLGA